MVKIVLALAGLVLLSLGGAGLYHLANSRAQTTSTCAEFVRQRPRSSWVRLTRCEIDYVSAGFRESGGQLDELLFPVRPAGRPQTEHAAIVAATHDPAILAIAQKTIGNGKQPDQEQFLVMMLKVVTALRASREIEGVTRDGVLQRARDRRLLSGLGTPVAPDVMLIDLHARPDATTPAIVAAAGVLALLAAALLAVRGRRARRAAVITPAVPQPATVAADADTMPATPAIFPGPEPAAPSPDQPAVASVLDTPAQRLRVLLLNLPPDAGVEAIETAPPLGDADQVSGVILQRFPDMRFDDGRRGTVTGPRHTMTIDLGRDRVVHAAIADVRGSDGILALKSLLTATRWRAYVPKAGAFADADRLEDFAVTF